MTMSNFEQFRALVHFQELADFLHTASFIFQNYLGTFFCIPQHNRTYSFTHKTISVIQT